MDLFFILNSAMLGFGLAMDAFCVSMTNGLSCGKLSTGNKLKIAGTYAFFQFLMPVIGWVCVHTVAEHFTVFHKMVPWIALVLLLYIGGKMLLEAWEIHRDKKEEASTDSHMSAGERLSFREPETAGDGSFPREPETAGDGSFPLEPETAGDGSFSQRPETAGDGPPAQRTQSCKTSCATMVSWSVLLMQGIATSIDALSVGFTIADYQVTAALTASLIIALVTLLVCLAGIRIGQILGNVLEEKANILGGCILIFIGLEIFIKGVFL